MFRKHWTPRYIYDRLRLSFDMRIHPDAPWITRDARHWLEARLNSDMVGIEWGSGRSTLWLARQVRHVTSIENKPEWHAFVSQRIADRGVKNVDYHLIDIPYDEGYDTSVRTRDQIDAYVNVAPHLQDESLDFALVDGCHRDYCTLRAMRLLKPGGLLILDNSNRYIPSRSRVPERSDAPRTVKWREIWDVLGKWETIRTTDGVWDTTMFLKPGVNK